MTTLIAEPFQMAKTKTTSDQQRDRIDLRAEPEWIARVDVQSKRLGISVSAYIRQAVTLKLERDEAEAPKKRPQSNR